jgi:hypothetical protein
MEPEELERIPWAQLIADRQASRVRTGAIAAVVVAAGIVTLVGVRWLTGGSSTPVPVPVPPAAAAPTAVPPGASPTTVPVVTVPVAPVLPTEVDLMAEVPAAAEGAVRLRAEWFVRDYFTVDGAHSAAAELAAAFVTDAALPDLPQADADPGGVSYVEWARAYRIRQVDASRWRVAVAFRTLYRVDDDRYARSPVRAVEVLVVVGPDGSTAVADLPSPILPPAGRDLTGWDVPGGPASDRVVRAALEYAAVFDDDPEILAAAGDGARWRVVVGVDDGSGISWPLVIRSDHSGG